MSWTNEHTEQEKPATGRNGNVAWCNGAAPNDLCAVGHGIDVREQFSSLVRNLAYGCLAFSQGSSIVRIAAQPQGLFWPEQTTRLSDRYVYIRI